MLPPKAAFKHPEPAPTFRRCCRCVPKGSPKGGASLLAQEPHGAAGETPGTDEEGIKTEDAPMVWPWIVGGIVLAALIAGGVVFGMRRRSERAQD